MISIINWWADKEASCSSLKSFDKRSKKISAYVDYPDIVEMQHISA